MMLEAWRDYAPFGAFVAVVLGLAALLAAEVRDMPRMRWVAKPLASAAFVALALELGAWQSTYGRWVLAALVLSWLGDVLLLPNARTAFAAGIGAFLLAHVAYIGAFAQLELAPLVMGGMALVLLPVTWRVWRWLRPRVPAKLRVPVAAYVVVITLMVAIAAGALVGAGAWLVGVGALLFYVSDLAVARHRFVRPEAMNRLVGLPLYYAAQVLFALSVRW